MSVRDRWVWLWGKSRGSKPTSEMGPTRKKSSVSVGGYSSTERGAEYLVPPRQGSAPGCPINVDWLIEHRWSGQPRGETYAVAGWGEMALRIIQDGLDKRYEVIVRQRGAE